MKTRTLFLSVCFVFAALTLAWAADVTGKWTAQVPGRGGQTREQTFNLKAEGTNTVSEGPFFANLDEKATTLP